MKKKLFYILLLFVIAGCQQEQDFALTSEQQEITLTIPAPSVSASAATSPLQGRSGSGADKTAWQEGDILYIGLVCTDASSQIIQRTNHIARYTAAGEWQYDKPLTVPPTTNSFDIIATYTAGALPGEAITGDMLNSYSNFLASTTAVTLRAFDHIHSRLTFTGLPQGDKLQFQGNGWYRYTIIADNYSWVFSDPLSENYTTADPVFYAYLYSRNGTYQFRILPGGNEANATQWYNFDPGEPNTVGLYENRTYTINCEPLLESGTHTPGGMEELERFLAWAARCRAITSGSITEDFTLKADIDLTGIDWEPIGKSDNNNLYSGTFDGGGHTIRGLRVNTSEEYAGLFGYIHSATIKNLTLSGATVTTTHAIGYAGTFAGTADYSYLIACRATDCTVTSEGISAAGIVASSAHSTLVACHTRGGSIRGNNYAAGITGYGGTLIACVSQPTLVKSNNSSITGALMGEASSSVILTACWWHPYKTEEDGLPGGQDIGQDNGATITDGGQLTSPTAIDPGAVIEMNAAIDTYNAGQADDALKCIWRW